MMMCCKMNVVTFIIKDSFHLFLLFVCFTSAHQFFIKIKIVLTKLILGAKGCAKLLKIRQ